LFTLGGELGVLAFQKAVEGGELDGFGLVFLEELEDPEDLFLALLL
jgi:hypothetical protein